MNTPLNIFLFFLQNPRSVIGEVWEEFCDTLKAAGATMLAAGTPKDAFNQASIDTSLTLRLCSRALFRART